MGRKRLGDKKGAEAPAAVRPEIVVDLIRPMETLPAGKDVYGEIVKNALSTESLERILIALQDGEVEYGAADCELIGEIICEVLELRKTKIQLTEKVRYLTCVSEDQGRRLKEHPIQYKGAEIIWDEHGIPDPVLTATEERIRMEREAFRRVQEEAARYGSRRAHWENSFDRDEKRLVAPDGSILYRMSGLEEIECKSPKDFRAKCDYIEKHEMSRWRARKGLPPA